MRNGICFLVATYVGLSLSVVQAEFQEAKPMAKLSKRTESVLATKVLPGYQLSNRAMLLDGLATVTAKKSPEQLESLEERLRLLGLPTSGRMMVDAYMSLLTQGRVGDLPEPELREIVVMIPAMEKAIKEVLVAVDDSVATIEPLPMLEQLEDYEGLFWDIHVLENKMMAASHFARYGASLMEQAKKKRSRGYEEKLAALSVDFADRVNDLERAHLDLQQRKWEFRLDRMELAKKTLGDAGGFMNKMQAAFAGQVDAALFRELFAAGELPVFDRERLQDSQLQENVSNLAVEIEALSGDFTEKSRLFFVGSHWWLRGRYGRGSDHGGLLKSVAAGTNPQSLFPLLIPEAMGKPAHELIRNPEWKQSDEAGKPDGESPYLRVKTESDITAEVPRRHHVCWMFEYRSIGPDQAVRTNRLVGMKNKSEVKTTKMSRFH